MVCKRTQFWNSHHTARSPLSHSCAHPGSRHRAFCRGSAPQAVGRSCPAHFGRQAVLPGRLHHRAWPHPHADIAQRRRVWVSNKRQRTAQRRQPGHAHAHALTLHGLTAPESNTGLTTRLDSSRNFLHELTSFHTTMPARWPRASVAAAAGSTRCRGSQFIRSRGPLHGAGGGCGGGCEQGRTHRASLCSCRGPHIS